MAINGIVQYTSGFLPDILMFTQALILVWFDGTIILHGSNTIYEHGRHSAVFVCFLPIYSGRRVRWMYQPGSNRRKVTQDFLSTFRLRCMPLFFSREGFSRSFPSSTVKSNFVY